MSQNTPLPSNPETSAAFTPCKNCHAPMPPELRFCRNCGYRLGEGPQEYTPTVRFPSGATPTVGANPFPGDFPEPYVAPRQAAAASCGGLRRRGRRLGGMNWIVLAIVLFFAVGGGASFFVPTFRRAAGPGFGAAAMPRSYFGVDGFEKADSGVTFSAVEPPGGPADKAGLVGGDTITSFDGQAVTSDSQMRELLGKTPNGKTVDVIYIRDGETKTTKLTTVGKAEFDQLASMFRSRPEGQGRLGIENEEVVEVTGTKLHGVKVEVDPSRSAALAGIQNGDVIIEVNDVPIRTVGELHSRIYRAIPYSTILIKIIRGGESLTIPVKMGRR